MPKKINLSIKKLAKEIEKYTAENGERKEALKYMRNKIVELGANTTKHFTPFKHRQMLYEHAKKKQKAEKEMKRQMGTIRKRKK